MGAVPFGDVGGRLGDDEIGTLLREFLRHGGDCVAESETGEPDLRLACGAEGSAGKPGKFFFLFLLFALSFNGALLFSQTLFTYGNTAVDKEEFLRAYNKNKTTSTDKEKALREYLDLYSKFKLKVK